MVKCKQIMRLAVFFNRKYINSAVCTAGTAPVQSAGTAPAVCTAGTASAVCTAGSAPVQPVCTAGSAPVQPVCTASTVPVQSAGAVCTG